ncbi:MAG: hypothetical protein V1800_16275 [Candidatus Latescibacterota bacterium]
MARSRPRKNKLVKVRQERTEQHLEHRARKEEMVLLHDVVASILRDCPPAQRKEPMGHQEIERWFDTDPEAPVILLSRPLEASSFEARSQVQISVNQNGVERELRIRGIDENHPSWALALDVVGPTLRDMTAEVLAEATLQLSEALSEAGEIPTE